MVDDWTRMLDKKNTHGVQIILKDFSKAFDRMQHSIFAEKLRSMDIHPGIIKLCMDFLTDRNHTVSVNGNTSQPTECKVGCPQGTIAGPLFWIAYVNNLKPPAPTETVIYADDTGIPAIPASKQKI